jgi:hypothetical protein
LTATIRPAATSTANTSTRLRRSMEFGADRPAKSSAPSRIRSRCLAVRHCERSETRPASSWHYRAKPDNRMNGKRRPKRY